MNKKMFKLIQEELSRLSWNTDVLRHKITSKLPEDFPEDFDVDGVLLDLSECVSTVNAILSDLGVDVD